MTTTLTNTALGQSAPAGTGEPRLFTLRNAHGMHLTISERGAALVSWWAPDRYGRSADVLLGYREPQEYADDTCYFGAIVGRWANRIARGQFALDGKPVQAAVNDRGNHLHGGPQGFHAARWHGEASGQRVSLRLDSPSGQGGFPGNVEVQVDYTLGDDGSLCIEYQAVADAATPINLTSHPYFNLNGGRGDVGDHMLQIDADYFFETDAGGIPTCVAAVEGTPFDFRSPAAIGPRLRWPDRQVGLAGGFDHCYCVGSAPDGRHGPLREVARAWDPRSGRRLQVSTTEAGLQFYSGNALEGVRGRSPRPYARHAGFCLEAGAYPDQVNGEHAGAVILRPGEVYRQTTVYRLSLQG
ncbi:aldose epimerase family protein [Massilia niabensis]|uniref:Aldose 1-epimerase n=1 Tax=Massilia niabensis TaxID=544910 RepID=A0ABW0LCG4_9BURK